MTKWKDYEEKVTKINQDDELIVNEGGIVKRVKAIFFRGKQGLQGEKGDSITNISTFKTGKTTTVTISSDSGDASFDISDGVDGSGTGDMLKSENLAGLANVAEARSNLGIDLNKYAKLTGDNELRGGQKIIKNLSLANIDHSTDLGLSVYGNGGNTTGKIQTGVRLGEGYSGIYSVDGGLSGKQHLGFFTGDTNSVVERIRILDNGNVGIGITSPREALDVNGKIVTRKNIEYKEDNNIFRWGLNNFDNGTTERRFYIALGDENGAWIGNPIEIDNYSNAVQNSTGITRKIKLTYPVIFSKDVSLNNKCLYIRNYGDNNHGIKHSSSIDGPEIWGYYGTSLGDRDNHQIIKAYKGKGYIGNLSQHNSVIFQSKASISAASSSLNYLPNSTILLGESGGNIYFLLKSSTGAKRKIVITSSGTIQTGAI